MKLFPILIFAMLLSACGVHKNNSINDGDQPNANIMLTATIGEVNAPSDPFSISDVRVQGNKMFIEVSYSGGCQEHAFQLVGSSMIAKSLPPIRHMQLVHESNDDACRMMILKTIEIDVKALAYQQETGSKIYLTIEGWQDRIEYTYE
ncbi:MAG: hypothetical protein ACK457_01020 [Flavobacteriia bacterium]